MTTPLSKILTNAKLACIHAEQTGKLDIKALCKTAVEVAMKINLIPGLKAEERDALILLFLKKGLSAVDAFQKLGAAEKDTILQTAFKAAQYIPAQFNCCLPSWISLPSWVVPLVMEAADADILKEAMQSHTARTDLSGVIQLDLSGVSIEHAAAQFLSGSGVSLRAVDLSGADLSGAVPQVSAP